MEYAPRSPSPPSGLPSNRIPNFLPSTNSLNFTNSWSAPQPDSTIATPLGNIGIGDASNGLCGGMVFTVRDLFEAKLPPPSDTTPPKGTSLFNYIVRSDRQPQPTGRGPQILRLDEYTLTTIRRSSSLFGGACHGTRSLRSGRGFGPISMEDLAFIRETRLAR